MSKKQDLTSCVVVKTKPRTNTVDGTQQPCLKPRLTETEALMQAVLKTRRREVKPLHQRLLYLERVGMQPQHYPHERNRPKRGIYGAPLYDWIGKQVGMSRREVCEWLLDADEIYRVEGRLMD